MSAAMANVGNSQVNEENIQATEPITKPKQNQNNYKDTLIVHYKHEKRFAPF